MKSDSDTKLFALKFPNNPKRFSPKIFSQDSFTQDSLLYRFPIYQAVAIRSCYSRFLYFRSWMLRGTVDEARNERCFTVIRDRSANRLTRRKNLSVLPRRQSKGARRRRRRPFGHWRLQKIQTATSIRTHAKAGELGYLTWLEQLSSRGAQPRRNKLPRRIARPLAFRRRGSRDPARSPRLIRRCH